MISIELASGDCHGRAKVSAPSIDCKPCSDVLDCCPSEQHSRHFSPRTTLATKLSFKFFFHYRSCPLIATSSQALFWEASKNMDTECFKVLWSNLLEDDDNWKGWKSWFNGENSIAPAKVQIISHPIQTFLWTCFPLCMNFAKYMKFQVFRQQMSMNGFVLHLQTFFDNSKALSILFFFWKKKENND